MRRTLKDYLKKAFFFLHRFLLRLGVAVYPAHYYSSAVDIIALEKTKSLWVKASNLPGLRVDLEEQLQSLRRACLPYQFEYAGNEVYRQASKEGFGPGYGYIEAQALYATVRFHKPSRILEVGSGVSTACSLAALERNLREGGKKGEITCVEPYPSRRLKELAAKDKSVRLIEQPVQAVPLSLFEELSAADILFIDSSHTVKAGSDVNRLVLEALPRLKEGVLVHFHDIYFPYDYQRDLLQTFLHNNETSLLRAFLCFNRRFEILYCLSHLHYERPQALKELFPEYQPQAGADGLRVKPYDPARHFPSSIWLRVLPGI